MSDKYLVDNSTVYTLKNGVNHKWFGVNVHKGSSGSSEALAIDIAMKLNQHDKLTAQVAELRAALETIKHHQQSVVPSGFEFSSAWQIADKALKDCEL